MRWSDLVLTLPSVSGSFLLPSDQSANYGRQLLTKNFDDRYKCRSLVEDYFLIRMSRVTEVGRERVRGLRHQ